MSFKDFSTIYYEIGGFNLIFHQILYQILVTLNNERTVSSAYHLLKGKRSGQTIQDVGIFKLHMYFGLLPKLKRSLFDEAIVELQNQGIIHIEENGFYQMNTDMPVENHPYYYNGWRYRGNEHQFFSRLSLLVETLSYVKHRIRYFAPTEKNTDTQQFIRAFLKKNAFQTESFRQQLHDELHLCLAHDSLTELQRELIVSRLSGVNIAGVTWKQLAQMNNLEQMDVYLIYISSLHLLLNRILTEDVPILRKLATNIEVTTPLTESTKQTAFYIQKGYSIDQIANVRRLKTSTIEDHIVEMALNIPSFSIEPFLSTPDLQTILSTSEAYQTKKLRVLKEIMPHYSYFQIRLALAKGE